MGACPATGEGLGDTGEAEGTRAGGASGCAHQVSRGAGRRHARGRSRLKPGRLRTGGLEGRRVAAAGGVDALLKRAHNLAEDCDIGIGKVFEAEPVGEEGEREVVVEGLLQAELRRDDGRGYDARGCRVAAARLAHKVGDVASEEGSNLRNHGAAAAARISSGSLQCD